MVKKVTLQKINVHRKLILVLEGLFIESIYRIFQFIHVSGKVTTINKQTSIELVVYLVGLFKLLPYSSN